MSKFEVTADYGEIKLGPFRAHWYNKLSEQEPAYFILGWGDTQLEFGEIDQERPGIYLTRYVNHDVEQLRTIATF